MSAYRTIAQRRGMRGDPGLFGFLGKVAGGIVKSIPGVGSILSGAEAVGSLFKKPARGTRLISQPLPVTRMGTQPISPVAIQQGSVVAGIPSILRGVGRVAGTGLAGFGAGEAAKKLFGGSRRRYRRMNPTNPKALRRAIRRVQRFGEFARAMGYSKPPRAIKGFRGFPKKKRAACQ